MSNKELKHIVAVDHQLIVGMARVLSDPSGIMKATDQTSLLSQLNKLDGQQDNRKSVKN